MSETLIYGCYDCIQEYLKEHPDAKTWPLYARDQVTDCDLCHHRFCHRHSWRHQH